MALIAPLNLPALILYWLRRALLEVHAQNCCNALAFGAVLAMLRGMLRRKTLVLWAVIWCACLNLQAASSKIIKVLPHYLDRDGQDARSPSLFDRDAYQAYLRKNPALCTALRFDIQWRSHLPGATALRLRAEIRTAKGDPAHPFTVEKTVHARTHFSRWTPVPVTGEDFKKLGQIIAWRVTLWNGDEQIAEQKSFLW